MGDGKVLLQLHLHIQNAKRSTNAWIIPTAYDFVVRVTVIKLFVKYYLNQITVIHFCFKFLRCIKTLHQCRAA